MAVGAGMAECFARSGLRVPTRTAALGDFRFSAARRFAPLALAFFDGVVMKQVGVGQSSFPLHLFAVDLRVVVVSALSADAAAHTAVYCPAVPHVLGARVCCGPR